MAHISSQDIQQKVEKCIVDANIVLPEAVSAKINTFADTESSSRSKGALRILSQNMNIATEKKLPLCQDTGTAVFFVKIGHEVVLEEPLFDILSRATETAYKEHHLRASIVADPLFGRKNTKTNTPPTLHIEQVRGKKLEIWFLPKGGGAENKSIVRMLRPADGRQGVIDTVVESAEQAGGSSCPPWILGIGIGGGFDSVATLAKHALLRPLGSTHKQSEYAELEHEIFETVENLGIGTMGFGGKHTLLGVHIHVAPTHIASLPVAVNFQCHSARMSFVTLE